MAIVSTYATDTLDSTDYLLGTTSAGAVKRFAGSSFRTKATAQVTLTVGSGQDFATIEAAYLYAANNYDMAGNTLIIDCVDGEYDPSGELLQFDRHIIGAPTTSNASSGCILRGNVATPANCIIDGCIEAIGSANQWYVEGFKFTNNAFGIALWGHAGGWIRAGNIDIGAMTTAGLVADYNGTVEIMDDFTISGGATFAAVTQDWGRIIVTSGTVCTVTGTPAFSAAFAYASENSAQQWNGATFSGSATGSRFWTRANSTINTGGGGANFFPGNAAGTTDATTFGVYL